MQRTATRASAGAALLLVTIGAVVAAAPLLRLGDAKAAPEQVPLRLTAPLRDWLAPEAVVRVSGWAGENEHVRLLANGQPLGAATSGELGRFFLEVRAPRRSGRYGLVLRGDDRRTVLPDLVVRPVVLAAVGDVNLGDRIDVGVHSLGADAPWKAATPILSAADIAVANLECAVSTRGSPVPKEYNFRG